MSSVGGHVIGAALTGGLVIFLCRVILTDYNRKEMLKLHEADGDLLDMHHGSCHCKRVLFRIKAPKKLREMVTTSKSSFPRLAIPWYCFELLSEESSVSLYTKPNLDDLSRSGDYGVDVEVEVRMFCSFCGMHILYSPSLEPDDIQVNMDCMYRSKSGSLDGDAMPMDFLSEQHNRRGKGAFCSPHAALASFRSMLVGSLSSAFEYAGLPHGLRHQTQNSGNENLRLIPTEGCSSSSKRDVTLRDRDRTAGGMGGMEDTRELWTQMLSHSAPSVERTLHNSEARSRRKVEISPSCDGAGDGKGAPSSPACAPNTDGSAYSDVQSDVETWWSDNDDSLSVLSNLLTGEPSSPIPRGSQTVSPRSPRGHQNSFSCPDPATPDTPSRLHLQLRQHLSHYLRKKSPERR